MLRSETAASPERRQAALAGLTAFQIAKRTVRVDDRPVIARSGRARLVDYGGVGPPAVFVPSLINPPFVLDLDAESSLLRWLATQGVRPMLVDWGAPARDEHALDIAGHVETLLLPLLAVLGEPAHLVGYCLGGTMTIAAAMLAPSRSVALIAAPWRFAGFGTARDAIAALWAEARASCEAMGLVPVEVLQAGFWRLDPAKTIAKYEAFGAMPPDSGAARSFIALEDWANAGAPLTHAAGRDLFEDFIGADAPGTGGWRVGGQRIDPAALSCPTLDIISTSDRIVPAATATGLVNHRRLDAGHVGMIVGSRARTQLWEPLRDWLSQARMT